MIHEPSAVQEVERERKTTEQRVSKKRLVDSLNSVHFREDPIIIHLEHTRYGTPLFLRAFPQPCSGDLLQCTWAERCPSDLSSSYAARNFMVDRGLDLLIVEAQPTEITNTGITLVLPEECRGLRLRRAKRYVSEGIKVTLMQAGATCSGTLDDFTADSFRILVPNDPRHAFKWINQEAPLYVVFSDGKSTLFTGECRIIRHTELRKERALVLEPTFGEDKKLRQDRLSGEGYLLVPRPILAFKHPLARKRVSLEVDEISASWFSVTEYYENAVFVPGLVLPEVELEVAPGLSLTCTGQVSSGDVREVEGQKTVKWWIVVLDMGIEDQTKLFALLQRVTHQGSHPNSKIDLDDLLRFFFDAGFVYPKKYSTLHAYKERFKELYQKLYLGNPTIARHFVQLDKGIIQGHLSMIRFYENTWMIHHHAAVGQNGAGLKVLKQVSDYVNDYGRLYSSHMDYLMCYFRPNNRFPSRVFGGFARTLANRKQCSTDAFAYLTFGFAKHERKETDESWRLDVATVEDAEDFSRLYESVSGGLMIKALDLGPDMMETDTLSCEYEKLGFKREKHLFSLKKNGILKALVLALVSDTGLNLSNLTNCVHVFVIDREEIPAEVLYRHLASLSSYYAEEEVPVLLYPLSYAENQSIPYEKVYELWAFDTRNVRKFYEYMNRVWTGKWGGTAAPGRVRSLRGPSIVSPL